MCENPLYFRGLGRGRPCLGGEFSGFRVRNPTFVTPHHSRECGVLTHTNQKRSGSLFNSSLTRTRSLFGPMRPTVHLAGTEMRALLALRCVIGNDLFQAPDAILGEEMGSPESCRPKTSCAPNPTGVPVTGPNDGGVKCIGKSEFFNHVYKVMIDFIDIGKASAQNDDVRV